MKLSEISLEDGKQIAHLMKALSTGKWMQSSGDAEILIGIKKWVHGLALAAAEQIKNLPGVIDDSKPKEKVKEEEGGMKIKSIKRAPPQVNKNQPKSKKNKSRK